MSTPAARKLSGLLVNVIKSRQNPRRHGAKGGHLLLNDRGVFLREC